MSDEATGLAEDLERMAQSMDDGSFSLDEEDDAADVLARAARLLRPQPDPVPSEMTSDERRELGELGYLRRWPHPVTDVNDPAFNSAVGSLASAVLEALTTNTPNS